MPKEKLKTLLSFVCFYPRSFMVLVHSLSCFIQFSLARLDVMWLSSRYSCYRISSFLVNYFYFTHFTHLRLRLQIAISLYSTVSIVMTI